MKTPFLAILSIFILSQIIFAQSNKIINRLTKIDEINNKVVSKKLNFNKFNWNSEYDSVLKYNNSKPIFKSKEELDYSFKLFNQDTYIAYKFLNKKLISYSHVFQKSKLTEDVLNSLYPKLYYMLRKSYGKPDYTDTIYVKDIKKYSMGNPNEINSILIYWNFKNSIAYLRYFKYGEFPIIIKFANKKFYTKDDLKN